jgi:hypothetical protein
MQAILLKIHSSAMKNMLDTIENIKEAENMLFYDDLRICTKHKEKKASHLIFIDTRQMRQILL